MSYLSNEISNEITVEEILLMRESIKETLEELAAESPHYIRFKQMIAEYEKKTGDVDFKRTLL